MKTKIVALILALSAAAAAQSVNGYAFFAPGGATCCGHTSASLHFGAGVDAIILKGLGANVELGALGPRRNFGDGVMGVLSPGATYHFRSGAEQRVDPFVAGGYSLFFRSGHGNLGYFGGGMNYWFADKVGLRVELRDHVNRGGSTVHFWGVRFGVAFR